ncbi:hypothetical protein Leryth_025188 [Lithospermum erythrorhizon]|nr:hypothetical protein Leryth_025188 [Lithospermum erythrorhizon]
MMMMSDITKATFVTIFLLLANNVGAVDYVVGDMLGWTDGFDYQEWAKDKVFKVGDRLEGNHNVYKVDGNSFKNCHVPLQSKPLTSGNDIIELKSPGKKWYICGVADHCSFSNQKLAINVMPSSWWWFPISPPNSAPAPSPLDPVIALPPWYSWFPFSTPPSPAPAYGDSKNDQESAWSPWPMPPSPDSTIPPFWIPDLPAPSPSPYSENGDQTSTDNKAEAPWMIPTLPFPWIIPPTIAPSPTNA